MSEFFENSSNQDKTGGEPAQAKETVKDTGAEEKEEQETSTWMEWVRDIAIALVVAIIISLLIKPTIVKESSMEPNFYSNDYIFLSRTAYKFGGEPKRGDVVVFRTDSEYLLDEKGKNKLLIKRVIGLPGDNVKIEGGQVYINGEAIDQSYTKDGETWVSDPGDDQVLEVTVPEGELFCMGDNRDVSVDSRSKEVGCVDQDAIVGKAVFRLLPLSKIGVIHNVYEE